MSKVYKEVPENFNDIASYLISDPDQILDLFFRHEKHFFYDTCSILHHSIASSNDYIIDFFVNESPIIIITRTVLMELSSDNYMIDTVQIDYLRKIHEKGIPILLMNEELILPILKDALTITIEEANLLLGYGIKEVSKSKTAIHNVMTTIDGTMRSRILSTRPYDQSLFECFFQYARSKKTEEDSLAEELMLIMIIVLTKIPLGKYCLVSDDLKIRVNVISIRRYLEIQHNTKAPMQLTTFRLVYEMYKKQILTDGTEMLKIFSATSIGNIKVFCMGEEDIELLHKSYTKDELVNKILMEPSFSIAF